MLQLLLWLSFHAFIVSGDVSLELLSGREKEAETAFRILSGFYAHNKMLMDPLGAVYLCVVTASILSAHIFVSDTSVL